MSLGKQAAQGAVWNYGTFLVSKGLLFVATLVLARILSPADFGLVGMALLVITVLDIFREFGIGAALIYQQKNGEAAANLAFVMSASIGLSLCALNWLLAPYAVQFFKTTGPEQADLVTNLLRVLGFSLLFSSLGSTQDSLLQKEINYRRRMIPEVGRTFVKGGLQVGLALAGFGVWSLVLGQVIGEAFAMVILWLVSPWRPTRLFDRTLLRPMLGYGVQMLGVNGLGTLLSDVDYLIIGRLLGGTALGIYTLAFRIPELLMRNLSQAVSNVAFPVAARLQGDREAMRDAYLQMQNYMLVILAPIGFGLFVITPSLIHILFKDKWNAAIPVMQILSIYMVLGGINHWPGVIYKAVGRPDILNKLAVYKAVLLVPTLWWAASNYGIEGVAWGQLCVRLVAVVVDIWVVSRFVNISLAQNVRYIWPPMLAAIIMAAVLEIFFLVDAARDSLLVLAASILVGAGIYGACMWLFDRDTVGRLWNLSLMMLGRGRSRDSAAAQGEAPAA